MMGIQKASPEFTPLKKFWELLKMLLFVCGGEEGRGVVVFNVSVLYESVNFPFTCTSQRFFCIVFLSLQDFLFLDYVCMKKL